LVPIFASKGILSLLLETLLALGKALVPILLSEIVLEVCCTTLLSFALPHCEFRRPSEPAMHQMIRNVFAVTYLPTAIIAISWSRAVVVEDEVFRLALAIKENSKSVWARFT
jgi:hypothetical protein